ncbi:glycosyltransferase family 39 protein [Candidatus Woesearchaeota archaeon]|nr:glycosyltransferase family 39 protein [Candidatus Woesearchaeota archaeon]
MIAEIVFALLLVFFVYLLGSRILFRMQLLWHERILFSFGLGAVLTSLAVFYLGLLGFLYRWVFAAAAVLLLLFSVDEIKKLLKIKLPKIGWSLNAFFYVATALLILANFVMALAPVFSIDALNYHLPIAKYYAQQHAVVEMPNHVYSRLPHGLSMIFAIPELFGLGEMAAALISAALSSAAVLAVIATAHRFFSGKAAGLAGVMSASLPIYIEFASQPLVDLPVAFFSMLSFYAFLSVAEKKQLMAWTILFAIFAASLAFFRITTLFMPLIFGLVLAAFLIRQGNYLQQLKYPAIAAFVMLLVAAPWFLWVFASTGDPIYPFLSDFTHDPVARQLKEHSASLVIEGSGSDSFNASGFLKLFLLPFSVTFNPAVYDSILGVSPLFLAFMPLYFSRSVPKRKYAAAAASVFLLSMFAWQFTNPGLRYLLPALILLIPPAAYAAYWAMQNSRFRVIIFAAMILTLLFSGPVWLGIAAKRIPGALGFVSEQDYLAAKEDANPVRAVNFANSNLPDTAVVMLYQETRSYQLQKAYFLSDTYLQQQMDFDGFEAASQLKAELQNLGITHILVGKHGLADDVFGSVQHREALMDDLIKAYTEVLYEDEHHKLLKLIY